MKITQLIEKNCSPGDSIKESAKANPKDRARDGLDRGKTSPPLATARESLEPLEKALLTCSAPNLLHQSRIHPLSISSVSVISTIDHNTKL